MATSSWAKYLFYFFVATGIVGLGALFFYFLPGNIQVTPDWKQAPDSLSFQAYLKSNYSFASDTDVDGLSDGKEIIYGSDPLRNDTDGDSYLDGQEVSAGYDPLVAGQTRISERKDANLSIQYFAWLAQKSGSQNPALAAKEIEIFLREKGLLAFRLPAVVEYDIRFTNNDPQKIADYLTLVDTLSLPEEGSPYLAFAGQLIGNSGTNALSAILAKLDAQLKQIENAPVPPALVDLHRDYAGIWRTLQTVFADLKEAQRDPVLIYLNQKKGEWLVEKVGETETLRATIIAQLKLAPFKN